MNIIDEFIEHYKKEYDFYDTASKLVAQQLENALHREELPNICYSWVRIAAKQMGVGGDDSWGAPVHDEFRINSEKNMTLEFVISPII